MSSVGLVMWRVAGSMVFVLYCLLYCYGCLPFSLSGGSEKCQTLRQIYLLKRMTLFWLNSVVRWMVVENRKEKIGEKRMSIVGFEPTLSRTRTWVWRLRPHAPRLKYFKFPFMRQISNFLFISFIFYMGMSKNLIEN